MADLTSAGPASPGAIWYGSRFRNNVRRKSAQGSREERGAGGRERREGNQAFSPSCTWNSRRSSSPGSCGCAPFVRTCRTTSDRAPCWKQKSEGLTLTPRGRVGGRAIERRRENKGVRGGGRERFTILSGTWSCKQRGNRRRVKSRTGLGRFAAVSRRLRPNWRGRCERATDPVRERQQAPPRRRIPLTVSFFPRVYRRRVYVHTLRLRVPRWPPRRRVFPLPLFFLPLRPPSPRVSRRNSKLKTRVARSYSLVLDGVQCRVAPSTCRAVTTVPCRAVRAPSLHDAARLPDSRSPTLLPTAAYSRAAVTAANRGGSFESATTGLFLHVCVFEDVIYFSLRITLVKSVINVIYAWCIRCLVYLLHMNNFI